MEPKAGAEGHPAPRRPPAGARDGAAVVLWALALTSAWRWRLLDRYLDLPE